jgi:ribosomal protein S18 acetylase RimI-like enzyme
MQSIVSAAWNSDHRPLVPCTVGDLEWWVAGAGPGADLSSSVRIWTYDDQPIGWGWIKPPWYLEWFVRVDLAPDRQRSIRDGIIGWLDQAVSAGNADAAGDHSPARPTAWAADGWPEADDLRDRGFVPAGTVLTQFVQSVDHLVREPALPPGYAVRGLTGPSEIPARVEVHRAAFGPSKMTVEKYELLVTLDHYAYDRDLVVVAPDGSFAAFTMCWLDPEAAIGEFEPVGTHPDHRRLGLGRAVNTAGLRRLRELGARDVMVFSERSNAASEALYRSVGFREVAIHREYERRLVPLPA